MNATPPEGWEKTNKRFFKALLRDVIWKKESDGKMDYYKYTNGGDRFACTNGTDYWYDPSIFIP